MKELSKLLSRWSNGDSVDLSEFGGASGLLQAAEEMLSTDPLSTVEVIVENWNIFSKSLVPTAAILTSAVATENLNFVDEIHDVILSDGDVLDDFADMLVPQIRRLAGRAGILGDIATESWTRLALGKWCRPLPLRAHLQERSERAALDGDTSIYLVRSLGAAINHWGDEDLIDAMTAFCGIDEFEADASFELGIYNLGKACASETTEASLDSIRSAIKYLHQAEQWSGRLDARAYLIPIAGLLRYLEGGQIRNEDVETARQNVNEYLLGYRGLNQHWRQGRADTSIGWSTLLGLLNQASQGVATHWFDPSAIIEAAGALYIAETSLELVSSGNTDSDQKERSFIDLVRPRLLESFAEHTPSAQFIDLWLDRARSLVPQDIKLIGAVEHLRADVKSQRSDLPKVSSGSGQANKATVDIGAELDTFFELHAAIKHPPTLSESDLVRQVIADISSIKPTDAAATIADLTALVLALIQFTAFHLNQKQSGSRKIPWLGDVPDVHGRFPKEHVLSDSLSYWLSANGLRAQIEIVNIGGGEVDLAVRFTNHSFYIEVKRVLSKEDDKAATNHYGDQASQYAATDVPIVFLALLDYARRDVRIDLEGAVWTREHRPEPQSRAYSLTGFRIQGNVASPSASSRHRRAK